MSIEMEICEGVIKFGEGERSGDRHWTYELIEEYNRDKSNLEISAVVVKNNKVTFLIALRCGCYLKV